jgi:hypothetical protein
MPLYLGQFWGLHLQVVLGKGSEEGEEEGEGKEREGKERVEGGGGRREWKREERGRSTHGVHIAQ